MEENLHWLKTEGRDIVMQLVGLIQWSDMGRSDNHKTPIIKKLLELAQKLEKL